MIDVTIEMGPFRQRALVDESIVVRVNIPQLTKNVYGNAIFVTRSGAGSPEVEVPIHTVRLETRVDPRLVATNEEAAQGVIRELLERMCEFLSVTLENLPDPVYDPEYGKPQVFVVGEPLFQQEREDPKTSRVQVSWPVGLTPSWNGLMGTVSLADWRGPDYIEPVAEDGFGLQYLTPEELIQRYMPYAEMDRREWAAWHAEWDRRHQEDEKERERCV